MSRRSSRRPTAGWRSARPRSLTTLRGGKTFGHSLYRRRLRLEPLEDRRLLAVVTVTTLDDTIDLGDGVTSLREAIFATNTVPGADTIEFAPELTAAGPATILLTQGELKITDSLTINGPGADLLTIDASGNDPTPNRNNGDGSRVFWIDNNQLSSLIDVTIDGMVITGGDLANMVGIALSSGGAIFTRENVVLDHVAVVGNASQRFGGAVYVEHGSLRVSESMISDNNAQYFGGGIYAYSSTLLVESSIIDSNAALVVEASAAGGGGIRARESSVSITGSQINRNTSGASGGGIALQRSGLQISSSTISGNTAKWSGGGIIADYGLIGDDGPLSIVDTTITKNTSFVQGGGVLLGHSNTVISGSTISDNRVEPGGPIQPRSRSGGGVAHFSGALLIQDSVLMGNSVAALGDGGGGAVFSSGRLTMVGGQVLGNSSSGDGGGLGFFLNAEAVIQDSVIAGNSAGANGGGISYRWRGQQDPTDIPNARAVIEGSSIRDNLAGTAGGGIYAFGNVLVDESQVSANFAEGAAGGGIFAVGSVTLVSSTVNENSTSIVIGHESTGGGGIYAVGEVVVDRSTVSKNTSTYGGGAFSLTGVTAKHSTFSENVARLNGDEISTVGGVKLDHAIVAGFSDAIGSPNGGTLVPVVAEFSLVGHGGGTSLAEAPIGLPDANGNLIGGPIHGPIDPLLGPLAENGGFELPDGSRILTHALLPGSPAINAGDLNATAGEDGVPEFDQRGAAFARIVGGRIDIGAFEYQTPTDLNLLVDTLEDESDGDYSRGDLSLREAIELANASRHDGVVDTIRFDPALTAEGPATILLTHGELQITDSLTIEGPGADLLTIDASGNDPTPEINDRRGSRIFLIDDSKTANLTTNSISGLRLTGGDLYGSGGAIFSWENLTITKSVITGNAILGDEQGFGAGIFAGRRQGSDTPRLVIQESEITGNSTNRYGGGIAAQNVIVEIRNSKFEGNSASAGAGVSLHDSQASIAAVEFSGNNAWRGGGLYTARGHVEISSSLFEYNTAQNGGGIDSSNSQLLVTDSRFTENRATYGNGGAINGFDATIVSCEIHSNSASKDGGGFYGSGIVDRSSLRLNTANDSGGAIFGRGLRVANSVLSGNLAYGSGGGIGSNYGRLEIVGSTLYGNTADHWGGGVYRSAPYSYDELAIRSTTIAWNNSRIGGGLYVQGTANSLSAVESSTVVHNSATVGGGAYLLGSNIAIRHSIIADNWASLGRDLTGLIGTEFALAYSLLGDNSNSGLTEAQVGAPDGNGNLIGGATHGPIDPRLQGVWYRPTPAFPDGLTVFVPEASSPVVNAGDPAAVAGQGSVPLHDQRGKPFTRVFGGRIDIGAVEAIPAGFLPGDYNGDRVVDGGDYTRWRDDMGSAVEPGTGADGNGDGIVNEFDYAVWRSNFGATAALLGAGSGEQGFIVVTNVVGAEPPAEPGAEGQTGVAAISLESADRRSVATDVVSRTSRRHDSHGVVGRDRVLAEWVARRGRDVPSERRLTELVSRASEADAAVGAIDLAVAEFGDSIEHPRRGRGLRSALVSER